MLEGPVVAVAVALEGGASVVAFIALAAPESKKNKKGKRNKKKKQNLPGPSYPHITAPGPGTGEPGMAGDPRKAAFTSNGCIAADICVGIS